MRRYPNDFKEQYENFIPIGRKPNDLTSDMARNFSKWKWSVHLKKTVLETYDFIAQVGRDNTRFEFPEKGDISYYDKGEAMIMARDWHWKVKIGYHF